MVSLRDVSGETAMSFQLVIWVAAFQSSQPDNYYFWFFLAIPTHASANAIRRDFSRSSFSAANLEIGSEVAHRRNHHKVSFL